MRKAESGYSLVEVMVAIVVLTVAILPMVGMFEAALRAATTSGDYDRARACANQRLEQVKSLPYEAVKAGPTEGVCETSGFGYAVSTQFVDRDLQNVGDDRGLMKVTITVEWDDEGSYGVTGVVSEWCDPCPRRRFWADERGFTLMEALVAMSMMVAVLFSLYAVFDTTVRVFGLAGDELEAAENARLGLSRMEREIRAAYPQAGGVLLGTWEPTRIAFQNRPSDNPPETIVYSLNGGSPVYLRRNGQRVAGPLSGANGVRFTYSKSATNCSSAVISEDEIELVRVTLSVRTPEGPGEIRTLTTDVALRNRR